MSTSVENTLKLALEALKDNQHLVADNERHAYVMEYNGIIEKCEEALAQPAVALEQRSANEHLEPVAWRETHSKVIKALAAIVTVHTPDKLFDLDAIPRDPVMGLVQQIKSAIDGYKPPQRDSSATPLTWVGLTDEEILSWWSMDNDLEDLDMCNIVHFRKVVEEVQAKLKAKNERLEKNT